MFNKSTAPAETEGQIGDYVESLGSYLKEARVSQGVELSAIAEETSINIKNLIALEENNRAALPADVFNRGFVKMYAAQLNLDPEEALRLYDKQWKADNSFYSVPLVPSRPSSRAISWPTLLIILLVVLFFGGRFFYPSALDENGGQSGSTNDYTTMTRAAHERYGVTPAPLPQAASQNQPATPATEPAGKEGPAPEPSQPPMDQTKTPAVVATADQQNPAIPPVTPPYEITLRCLGQTKVSISLDGQQAIEQIVSPENSQTWQASKSFTLTLGSTSGVELTINGTPVPIKEAAGQTVTIHRP
jgi:cytoskeleton protein RodZ